MVALWRCVRDIMPMLPAKARRFLTTFGVLSGALSLLDVLALGLLALVMTPMVQGDPVRLPLVGEVAPGGGYVALLAAVSGLIIAKGLLAVALQWAATRRFATYELAIGDRLFESYLRSPWSERLKRNSADLVRIADVGIGNTVAGVLIPAASLPGELMTFLAVLVVLFVAQPVTALVTTVYLGGVAALLYLVVSRQAVMAGRVNRDFSFRVARLLTEMVGALKEITLRGSADEVAQVVRTNRSRSSRARANLSFLSVVPRYILESALIGGFLLVGGVGYLRDGTTEALSAVALFGAAGFRLVPSLTRFQAILTQTSSNIPHARSVIADSTAARAVEGEAEVPSTAVLAPSPRVLELRDVSFTYPGADVPAIRDVSLTIPFGSAAAFVGSSGAGKSTLVDLLLGLLSPSGGTIAIDGVPLQDVLVDWRSRVGYVPQEVALFDATVGQNVALTWREDYDRERAVEALRRAQLWDAVEVRDGGLDSRVGERGLALSGGQRQRLGIARALYADPLVLVMDEATSALDTATEAAVSRAIADLRGDVTVIVVAHRLSTVRHSDQVCFLRQGRMVATGSFDDVAARVPEFAEQVALAGLSR